MKISNLILTGFAIAITAMLAISAFSIYGTSSSSKGFVEYRALARDTNLAGRLQANMLMVRLYVKDFLISNSDAALQGYKEHLAEMNTFLNEAKTEIQDPERAAKVQFIANSVVKYEAGFEHVAEVIKKRNAEMDNLLSTGLAMRKALTEIMQSSYKDGDPDASYYAGRIQEHVLLARYYALDYVKTSKESDLETVHSEIGEEIDKLLPNAVKNIQNPRRKELLADFMNSRKLFIGTVNDLTSLVRERNNIVFNTLDKIGPEIANAVEEVKLSIKAQQDTLGPILQARNAALSRLVMIVSVVGILVAIFFSFYIKRKVMVPLGGEPKDMGDIAELIAQGRLDMELKNSEHATGLYASMIKMVKNLTNITQSIRVSSESVASGSIELSSASEELSVTLTEQTTSISSIASAMEEMAASSINVLENINLVIEKSSGAKTKADEGKLRLGETNNSIESIRMSTVQLAKTIDNLGNSSNQISDILSVINDIADQTNLLALNAAIEAARAGEAGRGFAVVADEVRKLAERTQSAISEVENIIKSLQTEAGAASKNMHQAETEVERGVKALESTVSVFNSIVSAIDDVVDSNNVITSSVREQNDAIENVNESVQTVSAGLEQSTSAVREITITIDDLSRQAEDMNATVEVFKTR